MTDRFDGEVVERPATYKEIAAESLSDNRFYIYLLTLFPIVMFWSVGAAMMVHLHITEVPLLSTLEARNGVSFASRPKLGLYINFSGATLLLTLCVQGVLSSRGEVN